MPAAYTFRNRNMPEENNSSQGFKRHILEKFTAIYPDLLPQGIYNITATGIMVVAFVYACIRAWLLSMTHDEALTLDWHVSGSVSQIFLFNTPGLPDNNHLLHTLLVKLTTSLFGGSEFSVRLPSLLGYALYLRACYLLLGLVSNHILTILGALLLAFPPYLVDFFSVARGYSLALGLMMIGLYLLLKWSDKPTDPVHAKTATLASLMFALAVTANLSFLLLYISGLISWFFIKAYALKTNRNNLASFLGLAKDSLVFASPSVAFLLSTCIIPIKKINAQKLFALGGTDGFWFNTVGTLIHAMIYEKEYANHTQEYWYWLVYFVLILAVLLTIQRALRRRQDAATPCHMQIVLAFIGICSGISIIQHHVLGVGYLVERRAIFFIPLFLLLSISLASQIRAMRILRLLAFPIYAVVVALNLHFISCVNLDHYFNWRFDASTKAVADFLRTQPSNPGNASIATHWLLQPALDYYIKYYGMNWTTLIDKEEADGKIHDYYYEVYDQHDQWDVVPNTWIIGKYGLQELARYPTAGTYLATPKKPS